MQSLLTVDRDGKISHWQVPDAGIDWAVYNGFIG